MHVLPLSLSKQVCSFAFAFLSGETCGVDPLNSKPSFMVCSALKISTMLIFEESLQVFQVSE